MARMRVGAAVCAAAMLVAGSARSEEAVVESSASREGVTRQVHVSPGDATTAAAQAGAFDRKSHEYWGLWSLEESELQPAERTTRTPPHWSGDLDQIQKDPWIEEHEDRARDFVQPFLLSAVRPQFALFLGNAAGSSDDFGAELDQVGFLSFYWVEIAAPILTVRDGAGTSNPSWRVNGKLPLIDEEHHALTLGAGVLLPVTGPLVDGGGFNSWLGYAFGSRFLSGQARFGLGIDRQVGEILTEPEPLLFYDLVGGVRVLPWLQLVAQVDGSTGVGTGSGSVLRVMPGVRVFPRAESLTLGASFLGWWEQNGDWSTRRLGATVDVGYIFL